MNEYLKNIAYTKEAVESQIRHLHSFYQSYERRNIEEVNIEDLFFVSGIEEDHAKFPFKFFIESWNHKISKYFGSSRLVVEYPYTNRDGEKSIKQYYLVRNYPHMNLFLVKDNGVYHLLTGNDYQGATALNLDTMVASNYLPKSAESGCGWCITEYRGWDSNSRTLNMEGCIWGGPFEIREVQIDSFDNYDLSKIIH